MGKELRAEWYNAKYKKLQEQSLDETGYLALYETVISWLPEDRNTRILDLGCGSGRIAELIHNKGYKNYVGVDFSKVAIVQARKRVPQVKFIVSNVFAGAKLSPQRVFPSLSKKIVRLVESASIFIMLEFLEHVKEDLRLLRLMPGGSQVIFLVPAFGYVSHVRHFPNEERIVKRYHKVLDFSRDDIVKKMNLVSPNKVSVFLVNSTRRQQ